MPTIKELLSRYTAQLERAAVRFPAHEAEVIIQHVLGLTPEGFDAELGRDVDTASEARLSEVVEQRMKRVPSERLFGSTEFYGLKLCVGDGVFSIYPETEVLVGHALQAIAEYEGPLRILDVGTGSGCVLLALLNELPQATGIGVDCDKAAVDLARENARNAGLHSRAEFRTGNWCHGIDERFDLIVSNPPCVRTDRLQYLLPEMRDYDPRGALDGGEDGLKYYRLLAKSFECIAKENALAFVQVGPPIAVQVKKIFDTCGFRPVVIKNNFRGLAACVAVTNRKKSPWFRRFSQWLVSSEASDGITS